MSRRDSRQWRKLRATILNNARTQHSACYICGQPINYKTQDHNAPDAPTVDHIRPWRDNPELRYDPGNLAIAHRSCNASKGTKARALPTSGNTSRDWSLPQG